MSNGRGKVGGGTSNSLRGIPLSSMLRELPVSAIKQFTFSCTNKARRGCINISFFLSEKHAQLWDSADSSGKYQQESRASQTFQTQRRVVAPRSPSILHPSASQPPRLAYTNTQRGLYVVFRKPVQVKSPDTEPDPESRSEGWWEVYSSWLKTGRWILGYWGILFHSRKVQPKWKDL